MPVHRFEQLILILSRWGKSLCKTSLSIPSSPPLLSDFSPFPPGKIISAVCHGPAGLVLAVGPDGAPLVKGKKVTGFMNSEEEAVGKTQV